MIEPTEPPAEPPPETVIEPAAEVPPAVSWRPWGVLASLGLTVGTLVLYFLAQVVVVVVLAVLATIPTLGQPTLEPAYADGTLVAISLLVANPIFATLVVLLARIRGPGVREYLGLRWAGWKPLLGWTVGVAVFLVLFDLLGTWVGRPPVPEVMADIYRTAEPKVLLWVALVVMAPLFEELVFRGFLIPGLLTRMGARDAVIVSSGLFAVIHAQYDLFDMGGVLILGALFAAARIATGSTLLPMALHAGVNLASAAQMEWWVGG